MTSPALIEILRAASSDQFCAEGAVPVIGYVGRDVPVELIRAAGMQALRLRAPTHADLTNADKFLGLGVDPELRWILAGILAGSFGRLSGILVSSYCDGAQRLFYVLRSLHEMGASPANPPVFLVDMLHTSSEAVSRYNLARLREVQATLNEWSGHQISAKAIGEAIEHERVTRSLLRQVLGLRRAIPSLISGTQALGIVSAATRMPPSNTQALLRALLTEVDQLAPHPGRRIFLSGSSHSSTEVYVTIESMGSVIVGEDHEWGDLNVEHDVIGDDLDALGLFVRDNGPSAHRASSSARAEYVRSAANRAAAQMVVTYTRIKDDAPLWDAAAVTRASGLPTLTIGEQSFRSVDNGRLAKMFTLSGPQS